MNIAVALVESYSALTKMGNAELAEQLKIYKLLEKRTGSRQQEHAAWQWLRESGLQARPLLAGGRWRSLVPAS